LALGRHRTEVHEASSRWRAEVGVSYYSRAEFGLRDCETKTNGQQPAGAAFLSLSPFLLSPILSLFVSESYLLTTPVLVPPPDLALLARGKQRERTDSSIPTPLVILSQRSLPSSVVVVSFLLPRTRPPPLVSCSRPPRPQPPSFSSISRYHGPQEDRDQASR
jgi:hypothetical protein